MTFTEIKDEVAELAGLSDATDLARVGRSINRKYKEITSSLGIKQASRRQLSSATAVTMGNSNVTFTSTEKVANVYNRNVTPYKQLEEVTLNELRAQEPFSASDTPTQYCIFSNTADTVTIRINCVPQTAFDLYADIYSTAATLSGTDEPAFPESYHDILISAALIPEYIKQEKLAPAAVCERSVEKRLSELRLWHAVSTTRKDYQGKAKEHPGFGPMGSGGSSGSSFNGAQSWTQTGNIHFDRSTSSPFTVDDSTSAVVTNLDADKLDGFHATTLGRVNIKSYGAVCDGVTNDNTAILAAIADGKKYLFFPKNTLWTPTSNLVPANLDIEGEDWLTCIIKSSNVVTTLIEIGSKTVLRNIAIYDSFGESDATVLPLGSTANAPRPIRLFENASPVTVSSTHWALMTAYWSVGKTGVDSPGLVIRSFGEASGALFLEVHEMTWGTHTWVNNGEPTEDGIGHLVQCYGTGAGVHVTGEAGSNPLYGYITVIAGADGRSLHVQPSVATTTDINATLSAKTAGQVFNIYHSTSAFTGSGLLMNFAVGSGSFSGKFLKCDVNSSEKFSVNYAGDTVVAGTLNAAVCSFNSSMYETSIVSPSQITADQNNYAPTGFSSARVLGLSSDASRNITGLAGGTNGRLMRFTNTGAQNIVLVHQSGSSSAGNKFYCPGVGNFTLHAGDSIEMQYLTDTWYVLGF